MRPLGLHGKRQEVAHTQLQGPDRHCPFRGCLGEQGGVFPLEGERLRGKGGFVKVMGSTWVGTRLKCKPIREAQL